MKIFILKTVLVVALFSISLAPEAAAFYNPSTGRWLSRDPAQDEAVQMPDDASTVNSTPQSDGNLYTIVANDPLNFTDPYGLWKWEAGKRDGKARATVVAEKCGDSYADLANLVGLSAGQVDKWLKTYKANNQVCTGDKFTVPNTGYVDATYYAWGYLGNVLLHYKHNLIARWKNDGLLVKYSSTWSTTTASISQHLVSDDLYRYAYIGHGDHGGILVVDYLGSLFGGHTIISDKYTHFGINEMDLVACYSDEGAMWPQNVSSVGWLTTVVGQAGPINIMWGGQHGTQ